MEQVSEPEIRRDAGGRRGTDAFRNDPATPRVVTITERSEGFYERVALFPDGSTQCEWFSRKEPVSTEPAATGVDEAVRRLAEAQAGTLLHDGTGWWAFDGAIWRPRRNIARPVRDALRAAGVADPWPALVAAVEGLARSEPALSTPAVGDPDPCWDRDPWLLGTPGGTVELATGRLRPADPADRITRATAIAPAATADCPLWRRFLQEAMGETSGGDVAGNDATLQSFLQRFCGYALTGETCEHVALFGLGEGGNGKSVFSNTVRHILGSYAAVAAPDLLTQGCERRTRQAHSAEIATLAGARLVTASETEEGRTWADGRLKLLTGGDPVTARFLGRDPFTFTPRFKLLVVGNHLPQLRSVDAALRRRLCIVPFAHQPAVPDRMLESKLRAEGPAILRWMIEGCVAWREEGLGDGLTGGLAGGLARPAAVDAATDAYLAGQDLVGQFLAERCDRTPTCLETTGDLYAAWCAFAHAIGEPPGTQRRLATRLARHGLTRDHVHHARVYRGVRLLRVGELMAEVRDARVG